MLVRIQRNVRRLARLYRLAFMDERVGNLERAFQALEREVADGTMQRLHLQETTDALKSRAEVSPDLIAAFHEWKATNAIPIRPLVSVCVATYNRACLLTERCIPSVLGQTYGHLELIVVGDGCDDDTEERVARINDDRLRFVNLPQRGDYPTNPQHRWMVAGTQPVNAALRMARGDYITHLDDDDEYLPDRLERLVAFSVSHQYDFVWHPYWWETVPGEWTLWPALQFIHRNITTSSVFYRSWFKKIEWDMDAYRLMEPGDWNRFRRIKYIGPDAIRYPEPLLRHYCERSRDD